MASLSSGNLQTEDSAATQSGPACLRVPLILRKVMEHFSDEELIRYSFVNKQWNYEARSLIKYRSKIFANLRRPTPDVPDCQKLAVFASHVRQMNVVPFCGIGLRMDDEAHQVKCEPSSSKTLDPAVHAVLDRVPWTCFKVCFNDDWESGTQCPGFMLAKKVLKDFYGVLESFFLAVFRNHGEFFQQVLPDSTFPRLKVLCLVGRFSCPFQREETIFIKTIVGRCPNLQQLVLGDEKIDLTENLLEGSSAVLVLENDIDPYNDEICEDLLGSLRLKRMKLHYANGDFNMERFNRILPVVLEASRTTLYSMRLNFVFAVSLMRYGIRLENVTELEIPMKSYLELYTGRQYRTNLSPFWRNLRNFDFTRIFPKLNKVEILDYNRDSPWIIGQFIQQGNALPTEPAPDRAVNIKHLTSKHSSMYVPLIASMFPDIETLEVDNLYGRGPPYEWIWEHWADLKQIVVHLGYTWGINVDGAFCGIFDEEVAELREKDEEYLKAVNIVPVRPSITCMEELRTLTYLHQGSDPFNADNDPTFIFSKVTGLVAFSRCPNLSVTLEVESEFENAWSHMRDYANVVIV